MLILLEVVDKSSLLFFHDDFGYETVYTLLLQYFANVNFFEQLFFGFLMMLELLPAPRSALPTAFEKLTEPKFAEHHSQTVFFVAVVIRFASFDSLYYVLLGHFNASIEV